MNAQNILAVAYNAKLKLNIEIILSESVAIHQALSKGRRNDIMVGYEGNAKGAKNE